MSNLVKILFFGFIFTNGFSLFSQSDTTVLFQEAHPQSSKEISKIKSSNYGRYKDTTNYAWLEVNEIGIFKTTTVFMEIPKKEVDKNDKYKVLDGWIYGIKKDSLPAVLEGENYVFGMPVKTEVLSYNGKYSLRKIDANTVILNSQRETDSTWSIAQIYFEGNTVEYYSFDLYDFAQKNDTLQSEFTKINDDLVIKSLEIRDPEFFFYPGVQKYFKLESVFIRKED